MKDTRALDNTKIRLVFACFYSIYEHRNRGRFMLGVNTDGRISELLALTIDDVYQNRKPVTDLLFDRSIVKGGEVSRAVPVNIDGRGAITALIDWHREQYGDINEKTPLFPLRNKKGTVAMNRQTAHDLFKVAFMAAGLNGKIATHSLGNPLRSGAMNTLAYLFGAGVVGHRNVATTQKYIGVPYASRVKPLKRLPWILNFTEHLFRQTH